MIVLVESSNDVPTYTEYNSEVVGRTSSRDLPVIES